tara:strand:+ start:1495 stop:2490 length:996 start_codon:yes stop_codon:yes gene_type:complete
MEQEHAEVESPQNEELSLADASSDDIRNALGITSEPVAEEQAIEEPQAEEQIPGTEVESQQPEEEAQLGKRRIRPRNELDQQVIDLYRSEGFAGSFADASRVIYGQDVQTAPQNFQQPQEVEANEPDPLQGIDTRAEEIATAITELEGKVEQAADDLETTEALKYQREIMKKELELQNLTSRKERMQEAYEQQEYQNHQSKAVESRDKVYEKYPVLQDKNSIHRKQFDDFINQAQSHPDYEAVFQSPRWPELLANEYAASQPASQQQPATAIPQQQAPQMGTQAKVLTTGNTQQPVNASVSREGLVQDLPNMSKDDLYSLLGSPGGKQPLR